MIQGSTIDINIKVTISKMIKFKLHPDGLKRIE